MSVSLVTPGTRQIGNLLPLTEKELRDAERDAVYIFNVSPREHRAWAVGRQYVIPACAKGALVSEPLKIPGTVFKTDTKKVIVDGDAYYNEQEWIRTDGIDVAKRLLGQDAFQHESQDLVRMGCFMSRTEEPSDYDVARATRAWHDRCDELVRKADQVYSVNNGMVQAENGKLYYGITKDDIEAAEILGLERPWAQKNQKLTLCDECGTGNMPTAAFCKNPACGNMLNAEIAQRKFPARYAQYMNLAPEPVQPEQRRGPGRPPLNREATV